MPLRLVAGRHRGRALAAPPDRATRPTGERVREAVFNILAHAGYGPDEGDAVAGAVVLDAFAGTGALAFEALSRGAAEAWLFDSSAAALGFARKNAETLGNYWIDSLKKFSPITQVRGRGLMIGFDLPETFSGLRKDLLFKHHIFTGEAKPNTIRLLPSMAMKKDEADSLLQALSIEINQLA